MVFGQGPESSLGSRPWMLRSACVEELETGPGPLGARNSLGILEMLWKKIKRPSETHLFLYAVVVATGEKNALIKLITICGEFGLLTVTWEGQTLPLVRALQWKSRSHGLPRVLVNPVWMDVSKHLTSKET